MNEKEFNQRILKELLILGKSVFEELTGLTAGTYTAAELVAANTNQKSNKRNIWFNVPDADKSLSVCVDTFRCAFPRSEAFRYIWKFEQLAGIKQADKIRFSKIEESEKLLCWFDMWITKEHTKAKKLVSSDKLRPNICKIYLDPYNSTLVATDCYTLKEYPVQIALGGKLPEGLRLYIEPKDISQMVGRCSVHVYQKISGELVEHITEIRNESGNIYRCSMDSAMRYPNYRSVYPKVGKEGFIQINKEGVKSISDFIKTLNRLSEESIFTISAEEYSNKVVFRYAQNVSTDEHEITVTLESPAQISMKVGFKANNFSRLLAGWSGGIWITSTSSAAILDDKAATVGIVMPSLAEGTFCPNFVREISAVDRYKEPEPKLPVLYVDEQKTSAFIFALVELLNLVCDWFYKDEISRTVERLKMLASLSGVDVSELLKEQKEEKVIEEPIKAISAEPILPKDLPPLFPVPAWLLQDIGQTYFGVLTALADKRTFQVGKGRGGFIVCRVGNFGKPFSGVSRRFYRKGSHRIRDGTKSANNASSNANFSDYFNSS